MRSAPKTRLSRFAVPFTCAALLGGRAQNQQTTVYRARPLTAGKPSMIPANDYAHGEPAGAVELGAVVRHGRDTRDGAKRYQKKLYASEREARRNFPTT